MGHTKEPWHVSGSGRIRYIDAKIENRIYQEVASCMSVAHGDMDSNARRIVACVNACAGLDTELLENIVLLGDTLKSRFKTLKAEVSHE